MLDDEIEKKILTIFYFWGQHRFDAFSIEKHLKKIVYIIISNTHEVVWSKGEECTLQTRRR
jgi:hypothetical protein